VWGKYEGVTGGDETITQNIDSIFGGGSVPHFNSVTVGRALFLFLPPKYHVKRGLCAPCAQTGGSTTQVVMENWI